MKRRFLSFGAAAVILGLAACNNSGTTASTTDSSSSTTNTTVSSGTTTATSSGNYAAMADTVETNATKGYYLNPKTGKPYKSLKVDRSTGMITDETGEPVWRYVDNRNWWVYGDNDMNDSVENWGQIGEAKMDNDKLTYKGNDDKWTDYDTRYKKEDEDLVKRWKVSDHGMKTKMTTEDGDKMKVKTDEEGNTKIKMNGEKMKVDSNGNVKH
ncbi:hypothetical protein [Flavisolibacter ginsenosidimutans]|uniref:Lipoprotein n=1 Tax=Flavisolibacter ginsenosidimutans TaxID=661481 RepID=A0A5B8UN61_9BACT|nr:hypothetical protein [Flavisolibacter ginsenosidimutans]QEC57415.1 hypothetical protein FSB75_16400 [Flavisolibacter ginsenosidimutans]